MQTAPLRTSTYLGANAVRDIAGALTALLADTFGSYLKTKNFHWHVSGPHFRDYHLLLDEQPSEIFATTDPIAERVRKLGGTTLRSVGHLTRLQRSRSESAADSAVRLPNRVRLNKPLWRCAPATSLRLQ